MREPRVSRGPSGSRLRQPKCHFLVNTNSTPNPGSYKIIIPILVSNNIHSYPFKNTVKLQAYKNNLEHIYTTSQCLFFYLNTKKYLQPVKSDVLHVSEAFVCLFFCKIKINKKWFCKLIITLEGGKEYAHIFKNRHHLPSVREHFLGFV